MYIVHEKYVKNKCLSYFIKCTKNCDKQVTYLTLTMYTVQDMTLEVNFTLLNIKKKKLFLDKKKI